MENKEGKTDPKLGEARVLLARCLRNPLNLCADTMLKWEVERFLGPATVRAWVDGAAKLEAEAAAPPLPSLPLTHKDKT